MFYLVTSLQNIHSRVPIEAEQVNNLIVSMRMQVQPRPHSCVLRIQSCCKPQAASCKSQHRLQIRLGSSVTVAVV